LGQATQTGLRHRTLPDLWRRIVNHRCLFDRTGIEYSPLIVRMFTHLGLPSRPDLAPLHGDSIYSKRFDLQAKTGLR
jgi:hypothetical protein